jgi:hypothetical protein
MVLTKAFKACEEMSVGGHKNCPETATKLPDRGHENCPLMGSAWQVVVCLASSHG